MPCSVCLFSIRVSSTARDAALKLSAMSLLWSSGGRLSSTSPRMLLARRSMRSVGSLSGLDSKASVGQWLNCVRMRMVWECARNPRSVSLFIVLMRCSISICVALSLTDGMPRSISLGGLCIPSVGKSERRHVACLRDLFSMPSISVSCRSLKTPRWVAWYLDLRSCTIIRVYGLGFRV